MSWEDDWPLDEWPTRGELRRAIAETAARGGLDGPEVSYTPFGEAHASPGYGATSDGERLPDDVRLTIVFQVAVREAIDVALRLDPATPRQVLVEHVEAPEPDVEHYVLGVELVAPTAEEPPRVEIYSNEWHNRAAYPLLVVLAETLAARLIAITCVAN